MKILLSGGGTAGHITPLLAVADELKKLSPGVQIVFIGQKGDKNLSVINDSHTIDQRYTVRAGKFRRFHSLTLWQNITNFKVNLANMRDALYVMIGFFQSIYWLIRIRPDAIFFKGGFVVVPIGTAARLLRIPYMTHDSDPLPGLANRLIAKGAKKNAVVNSSVTAYPTDKTVVTGVPLVSEYGKRRGVDQKKYKVLLGFPSNSTLAFVYTGTQGARKVDDAMDLVLPGLLKKYDNLYVAYVFGRLNEESIDSKFEALSSELKSRVSKMTFVSNAYDYIAASDFIIGRAGATSLAEFATIGRASIIIPAGQLTGGHQLLNAKVYSESNAAIIVDEADLPDGLESAMDSLISQPDLRKELEVNIAKLAAENPARNIAGEIIKIVGRE